MRPGFAEPVVEEPALEWLAGLGYTHLQGDVSAPDGPAPERHAFRDAILSERLTLSVARLNPGLPPEAVHDAVRKVRHTDAPTLIERNRTVHRMLIDGVDGLLGPATVGHFVCEMHRMAVLFANAMTSPYGGGAGGGPAEPSAVQVTAGWPARCRIGSCRPQRRCSPRRLTLVMPPRTR